MVEKNKRMIENQKELLIVISALNISFEIVLYLSYIVNNSGNIPMGGFFSFKLKTIIMVFVIIFMDIMFAKNIIYLKKKKVLTKKIIIVLFIIFCIINILSCCYIFFDVFIR